MVINSCSVYTDDTLSKEMYEIMDKRIKEIKYEQFITRVMQAVKDSEVK